LGYRQSHVDEFIGELLHTDYMCDIALPYLPKRSILEETENLPPRVSGLEDELEESSDEGDTNSPVRNTSISPTRKQSSPPRKRSVSPPPKRQDERRRESDRVDKYGREVKKRGRSPSPKRDDRRRDNQIEDSAPGGSTDDLSVDEMNKLRISLGLKPLK